jgi:hypothetical protein
MSPSGYPPLEAMQIDCSQGLEQTSCGLTLRGHFQLPRLCTGALKQTAFNCSFCEYN